MNKGRLIAVSLVVLLTIGLGYTIHNAGKMSSKIQEQKETIAGLRGNVSYFESKVNKLRENVSYFESKVSELKGRVRSLNQSVFSLKEEKTVLEESIEDYKEKLITRKEKVENLSDKIERLKKREAIDFSPTKDQVENFLMVNDINDREWRETYYDCSAFSYDTVSAMEDKGMYACTVELDFNDSAHEIVATKTDSGIIYMEPQTDEIVEDLEVGDHFCNKFGCDWETDEIINMVSCYDN